MIEPHKARKANNAISSEANFRAITNGKISAAARMCAIGMIHYNITSGGYHTLR